MNVTLCWIVSFEVVPDETNALEYIINNEQGLFWSFISVTIVLVVLFITHVFMSWQSVELAHPLSLGGIFIFAVSVLLLSSFFVLAPSASIISSGPGSRFIDTHPIIFYDAVLLLILGILGAITNTVKDVYRLTHKIPTEQY